MTVPPGFQLTVQFPSGKRALFRWSERICRIGRSADADLQLRDDWAGDRGVSRRHASIVLVDGQYRIVDNDSTNGVYVNGKRVQTCWLTSGDEISIGNFRMRFQVAPRTGNAMNQAYASSAVLGKLELLDRVHRGEFSCIYKARVAANGTVVAVKAAAGQDDWAVQRLRTEWDVLSKLTNPHRLAPLAKAKVGSDPAIVYPWLSGGSLKECVRRRDAIPSALLCQALWPVASLLHDIHSAGLVHNDVKPSNVLLDDHGNGYLVDFGAVSPPAKESDKLIGSPIYMAPERLQHGACSPKSDIFSLGCTVYECVMGKPPFTPGPVESLLRQTTMIVADSQSFGSLHENLANPLRRMLALDPDERPSSAEVLQWFTPGSETLIWRWLS